MPRLAALLAPEHAVAPTWSARERTVFRRSLLASALVYVVYAALCAKYINVEEYLQVVEFASLKLGRTAAGELTWEYGAQIRGWMQPGLYVAITRAAEALGIDRPLMQLFLLRLVTGAVSWASLWMLIAAGRRWVAEEADRRKLYLIAALLWLLPYLGVRTSSETMSAAMICIGVALLAWREDIAAPARSLAVAVLAGFAFGLCFEFRYGSAVLAIGAAAAFLRNSKGRLLLLLGLPIGGVLALALGLLADRWGYGEIAFPALSYIEQNFVAGKANSFGTAPFFAYLYIPLAHAMAPVALALVVATLIAVVQRPRNVLVWSAVLYIAVLSLTAHKEARFVFPMTSFLPFFLVFALQPQMQAGWRAKPWLRIADQRTLKFLAIWNLAGLLLIPIVEATTGDFAVYRSLETAVYEIPAPQDVVVIRDGAEFGYGGATRLRFLEPKSINWIVNPDTATLQSLMLPDRAFLALVDLPTGRADSLNWVSDRCKIMRRGLPTWVPRLVTTLRLGREPSRRELYRCAV